MIEFAQEFIRQLRSDTLCISASPALPSTVCFDCTNSNKVQCTQTPLLSTYLTYTQTNTWKLYHYNIKAIEMIFHCLNNISEISTKQPCRFMVWWRTIQIHGLIFGSILAMTIHRTTTGSIVPHSITMTNQIFYQHVQVRVVHRVDSPRSIYSCCLLLHSIYSSVYNNANVE